MRIQLTASVSLVAAAFVAPIAAQQPRPLTAADYARAERSLPAAVTPLQSGMAGRPTWLADGRFWYRTSVPGGSAFFIVDPVRGTRTAAFDQTRLASGLAAASGGRIDGNRLPFPTFQFTANNRAITVAVQGRRFTCDLQQYACGAADSARGSRAPENSSTAPDGKWAVFLKDYNLWAKDLGSGQETQLTTDGVKDFGYATDNAGWIHSDNPVVTWSPDSRQIATFQHDGRGVGEMYLVSTKVGHPQLEAWKYPLPGDSVVFKVHRVIVNQGPDGRPRVLRLQMPPDAHRSTVTDHIACSASDLCDTEWYPDGSRLAFISSSRDHKSAWFRIADAKTGEVRTLFEEKMPTQVGDASFNEHLWRVLPASNELIWWSQRDNWIHLYLYDLTTGQLKNRITTGEGNVDDILRIDEKARTITFMASGKEPGRDPYFSHLYRIGFDGKGLQLLTPENAHHTVTLSPDSKYFVDSYSTMNTPPVTLLRDASGKVLQTLERGDISRLLATGWRLPTPIRMKARDGKTDIYGLMWAPSNLDSTKKYPIINQIYPGPQSGSVGPRSFFAARGDQQALADLGFIVVSIDGMGTPGRSKAFADAYYGRMGDNTLPDQVAGMKELAQRYRFIDIDRAAIWGHSGGGFAAADAMFRYPDFFKVGISESGNHDNRLYEDDWGERYQGLLNRSAAGDNYTEEANQTHAKNLKGKLFLVHGMMDDNVPPTNTQVVADALIKAGKDFDLLMLPHARHGYGADNNYVMRRRWDYFVKNLLGAEPPQGYQIGKPAVTP